MKILNFSQTGRVAAMISMMAMGQSAVAQDQGMPANAVGVWAGQVNGLGMGTGPTTLTILPEAGYVITKGPFGCGAYLLPGQTGASGYVVMPDPRGKGRRCVPNYALMLSPANGDQMTVGFTGANINTSGTLTRMSGPQARSAIPAGLDLRGLTLDMTID